MIKITPSTELLKIGSFSLQTWGVIVSIGIAIAIFFILKRAKEKKLFEKTEKLMLYILICAIIGARIAYIAINPSEFSSLLSYFAIWKGGLASAGVIIGAIIGIFLFKRINKIKTEELYYILDLSAPYLALALAIGRIGCFLRGCCFGLPTTLPWGVVYSGESIASAAGLTGAVHPTQLYHSIADFLIFLILLKLGRKKENLEKHDKKSKYRFFDVAGSIFFLFLMLYTAERFFIDFLRWHAPNEYIGIITITQLICIFTFAAAFFLLTRKSKK